MSVIKDLLSHQTDATLLKTLERLCRANERIADALESLLPSPLAPLANRDLKPPSPDIKIYGEKEAYWDELHRKQEELEDASRIS
jgi:hypothetical protein